MSHNYGDASFGFQNISAIFPLARRLLFYDFNSVLLLTRDNDNQSAICLVNVAVALSVNFFCLKITNKQWCCLLYTSRCV